MLGETDHFHFQRWKWKWKYFGWKWKWEILWRLIKVNFVSTCLDSASKLYKIDRARRNLSTHTKIMATRDHHKNFEILEMEIFPFPAGNIRGRPFPFPFPFPPFPFPKIFIPPPQLQEPTNKTINRYFFIRTKYTKNITKMCVNLFSIALPHLTEPPATLFLVEKWPVYYQCV